MNGVVNEQIVRFWGTERPRGRIPMITISPNFMNQCAIWKESVKGPEISKI